ncbi:MAG: hypothetical protein NTW86_26300 [Candidatus Sumerlaeota bacterium]|nr:hypothetical protein [Candidatus Sumerlaeota bacterium]
MDERNELFIEAMFNILSPFRYCPLCGKAWLHHAPENQYAEAWQHLAKYLAPAIAEEMKKQKQP